MCIAVRGVHSVLREIVCVRMRIFVCADKIWSVAWCHSVLREIVCVRMRIFVCACVVCINHST